MSENLAVGIDLGTTNSVIAYINEYGRPEVIPNLEGKNITPSVVQFRAGGGVVVGEIAKQEIALEKENTAHFFKRDMGSTAVYEYQGARYTPAQLSAEVLKKLKHDAESHLGREIKRAVITVPAYFHDAPRVATREAGELAGLEVAQMINEPTAAAFAYGLKQTDREEVLMVYDLGGGTFDITLVRIAPDAIEVIGSDGNHNLGGKDWDDRLLQYMCEEFERRHGIDPLADPYAFQELLLRAEDAKKALSTRSSTIALINCQGKMDRIEITRQLFEDLTRDLMAQTEMLMNKVLEETRYDYSRIDSVLMVGGSTRMPGCVDLVRRMTGKAPNTSANPDECVAVGASIQCSECGVEPPRDKAATGLGLLKRAHISDVTSHSMGMIAENADRSRYINSVLIQKNLAIPCRQVRPYLAHTRDGRDNRISVYITQGEGEDPANCSFVGKYVISGVTHNKKGTTVNICYEYDSSGVISVTAEEKNGGRSLAVKKELLPEDISWIFGSPKDHPVAEHKTIYLTIDLSGSMGGQPLKDAQKAMHSFVDNSDLSHISIGLISFSDQVKVDQVATQDGKKLHRAIDGWKIGETGYGNSAHPFNDALRLLKDLKGARFCVALTDGVWSYQSEAIEAARTCHQQNIRVIAIGFGSADEAFLKQIANSDQGAMVVSQADLTSTFENIAQVLVEGDSESSERGLRLWRR
jgi:molecular chaperone DnaK (HSP70)